MAKPDWAAIEADYLATGMSYPELAKKWRVSLSTLKKKAMRGKWGTRHAEVVLATGGTLKPPKPVKKEPVSKKPREPKPKKEPEPPLVAVEKRERPEIELVDPKDLALEMRAQRAKKMLETTDAMMDRIIEALELVDHDNTYALMTLVKALKDLRDMQGLNKSALDIEEQRMRIAKLKSEIRRDEFAGTEPLVIEFVNTDGAEV